MGRDLEAGGRNEYGGPQKQERNVLIVALPILVGIAIMTTLGVC
jgi:hypothetical protein